MQLGAAVIGKQKLEFKEKSEPNVANEPFIEVIRFRRFLLEELNRI